MRRASLVLVLLLLPAAVAGGAQQTPPRLAATLAACESGPQPAQRFAVFTGSMPALRGTKHMEMRFDLEERRGLTPARFTRIAAPKFGRWNRARRNAAGFVYTKRVRRLSQGRWYRASVRFRWRDARGRVQRTTRRVTPVCHQPDQRPNLQVESVRAARATGAGRLRYLVTVVNAGPTPAPASALTVDVAGDSVLREIPPLAADERTTAVFEARRCDSSSVVLAKADALSQVEESREDDNQLEVPCPEP